MPLYRHLNTIEFSSLTHPKDVSEFVKAIYIGQKAGFSDFRLDFSKTESAFPNASVPIAGLLEYYKNNEINFDILDASDIVRATKLLSPIELFNEADLEGINVLNKIFKFYYSDHVFWLVNAFLDELNKSDKFEKGVLEGLEWCLNEVMDNVIQHSETDCGFVMGQVHKSSKHVAFTIFDYGRGIFNSLKNSPHHPRNAVDALTLCLQEGVTRDKKVGQGNGMYGLRRIIENNKGRLVLTSNSASYFLSGNRADTFDRIPTISKDKGCAIIDFQLDYDNSVSLSDALKFNGKSYDLINLKIEQMENETGEIVFNLFEKSSGFGTRQAGERIRNQILNIYQQSNQVIVIDFKGIELISSSFADELIGKLVIEFGFFGFNNIIKLKSMNTLIQSIVQRSVSQRMAESLEL
jgi:hypothetical protein